MSPHFYVHAALWSQVIAAILFIVVLVWLWLRYFMPAILGAQERQNKQIAQAERHRDEAKATLDLLHREIAGAAHDAQLIAERAGAQAQREYDATVEEAREAGERALQGAHGEFDRALAAARARLRGELLNEVLERSRSQAASLVDASVDAGIVERFIASLEAPGAREHARG